MTMPTPNRIRCAEILASALVVCAVAAHAQTPQPETLKALPDTLESNSTQPVALTWPRPIADKEPGLSAVNEIRVGSASRTPLSVSADRVTFDLPALDVEGHVSVAAVAAGRQVGTATLTYTRPSTRQPAGPREIDERTAGLIKLYAVLLIGFPLVLLGSDIVLAYGSIAST